MKGFGIIGCGMIAQFHAKAIRAMSQGRLVAIFGRNAQSLQAWQNEDPNLRIYEDFDAFLADPEIDVVTIATPSGAHLEPALAAAKAGKHIACEKPLEVTTARIDQMIQACHDAGVFLSGILNRRFSPALRQFKNAVQAGRFGQLSLLDASIKWFRTQAYYDSAPWRGTWQLDGGGALMNQGIHTLDQLLYLAGPVKRVSASMSCVAHERIEVEDSLVALLEWENGARGTIQASTACWASAGIPAEVTICGSQGSAILADEAFRLWDFAQSHPIDQEIQQSLMQGTSTGLGAADPKAIHALGHQTIFENLVDAIEGKAELLIDGLEARRSVALIEAIYSSARQDGQWISLSN